MLLPIFNLNQFARDAGLLSDLLPVVASMADRLCKGEVDDLANALKVSTDDPRVHAVLTELFDKALHNHRIDQTNIDADFFIDQHGFVAFGLLHNQRFMHFYGHSNDWLRLTVDDLRALLVRGPNSRMNAKDLYDDKFMVRFMMLHGFPIKSEWPLCLHVV